MGRGTWCISEYLDLNETMLTPFRESTSKSLVQSSPAGSNYSHFQARESQPNSPSFVTPLAFWLGG